VELRELGADTLSIDRGFPDTPKQVVERPVGFHPVAQRSVSVQGVVVAPTFPVAFKVARFLEVGHNPLHGPFGDPDLEGDLAQGAIPILCEAHHDVAMVAEKSPI
jgi:hypothetical protein